MSKFKIFTVVRKDKNSNQIQERIGSFERLELANELKNSLQETNLNYFQVVKSDVYATLEYFQSEQDEELAQKILNKLDENSREVLHRYFLRRLKV